MARVMVLLAPIGVDLMGVNFRITATWAAAPFELIAIEANVMGGAKTSTASEALPAACRVRS